MRGARSSSSSTNPPRRQVERRPRAPLTTQMRDSRANANADQWMNGTRWRSKIAKSDHVIAIAAGRSPSGVENAYAAEVASKKNLKKKNVNQ